MKKAAGFPGGFSLVEVAISLAILAVGMTGVLALLPVGLDSARQVHAETIAASVARSAIGNFSTNGWSSNAFTSIRAAAPGAVLTNEYYNADGALTNATSADAVYLLQYQRGPDSGASCRYFLNLIWPAKAWQANTNSPLIQRRTFLVDVLRNY